MTLAPIIENLPPELQQRAGPRVLPAEPPITNWPPNLRRKDAARYLQLVFGIPVEASTLAKWFCISSDGPPAFLAGRIPLYPRAELDAWAIRRLGPLRSSTSAVAAPEGQVSEHSDSKAFEAASTQEMGRCKKLVVSK